MQLNVSHNLDPEELVKALSALADSSGIGEELRKAIRAKACDDTPKEPRHPAMRHLYRLFLQLHQEAARDIERYAQEILAEPMQKSQMSLFDWQPHHEAYERTDPRTGKQEHIAAKGTSHVVPPPSSKQEDANMETNLNEQLDAYKPQLQADYAASAARRLAYMTTTYGPDLKGKDRSGKRMASASAGMGKVWFEHTAPLTMRDEDGNYHLNPAKVQAAAEAYAEATVEAWRDKITGKIKDLQDATVHHLTGMRFRISGRRDDKKISIEQDMIVNRSTLGTLFNQFPARIYVDGKFISEAAYKKLTGADAIERQAAEAKRQTKMLTIGTFAKGDKVILHLRRKGAEESYLADGKVTGERDNKVLVKTHAGLFAIELEKLIRWNP